MDYEKKYNEAQKWMESIYQELSHEHQMEAEAFFPELKESEDERVRKGLIKAVSKTFEGSELYGSDVTREEALSWLEKQGEQKPAWSEEDEKNLQGIIDEIQANKNNAPSYDIPVYEGFLNWLKSLRPQKQWKPSDEQKHAWSEDDEKMINKLIAVVELHYSFGNDIDKQICLSWLKSLKQNRRINYESKDNSRTV